ncbi:G-protein coupled receptor 161-like [Clytia hemisphaerica]|uniref:G-protein coupled receptor 161-like n=1 Tax=Clytia hemisphaerica TaxID=252671 RepID=UPI0034D3A036
MEEGLAIFIVTLLAIIGAGFTLFTLAIILFDLHLRQKPSTIPIVSFLVAATIQGALAFPMYIYRKLSANRDRLGICDLYRVPYIFCGHILTMSLLFISLDRLFVILRPFVYQDYVSTKRFSVLVVVFWIVTLLVDSIPFITDVDTAGECVYNLTNHKWGIFVIILYIIIPLITIIVSYSIIWRKAVLIALEDQKIQMRTLSDDSVNTDRKHKRIKYSVVELKATKTSVVLIATYIICWGPLGFFYMVDHFCNSCYSNNGQLSEFRTSIKILALMSCFIAPAVYCWWNEAFRMATRNAFRKFKGICGCWN